VIRNKASDNGVLKYGKIEQNTVCNMLKDIIVHQNKIITITPQVLAYYLLIKYPEYRDAGETIERLLLAFESKCEQMQDEISFRLLSDAYFSVGNEESGAKYIREAELLLTIDKILTSELQEKGLKKEIEDNMDRIIEIIPKLEASATILVKQQNLEEATKIYEKIFMTYHKLMSAELIEQTAENIEQYKLAADNLATIALLTNNINLFIQLKMGIGAEINTELVEGIGIDIEQVLASEQEIMIRLTQLHTQQAQGVESSNSAQEAVESLGENRDELSDI
jgi:tetratricopeptide (TPR) repeat protein